MYALPPLTLCLTLAALAAGRPNNVRTQVVANQSGWTSGGASQVNQARGAATANSIGITTAPGLNQRDTRTANAAVTLQGASAGNGDFGQIGAVTTETQGRLGSLGTRSASFNQGRARNAAATGALTGAAGATQQVSQRGVLLGGRRPVGRRGANLNLNTGGAVSSQAGITGTGTFGGANTVTTTAEHVGPLAATGLGGARFRGTGVPALNNLRPTPPPRRVMMRMMGGRRGGRD